MMCIHYQVVSKKDKSIVIDIFDWYSSIEEAKEAWSKLYPDSKYIIKIIKNKK